MKTTQTLLCFPSRAGATLRTLLWQAACRQGVEEQSRQHNGHQSLYDAHACHKQWHRCSPLCCSLQLPTWLAPSTVYPQQQDPIRTFMGASTGEQAFKWYPTTPQGWSRSACRFLEDIVSDQLFWLTTHLAAHTPFSLPFITGAIVHLESSRSATRAHGVPNTH